eukprot:snap_masked-scaffold_7-processed-gene-10.43-mRNA-1 protein AED:1.00 eAED:1.00 QI:0/-1/0/0/-1/1/1/0/151
MDQTRSLSPEKKNTKKRFTWSSELHKKFLLTIFQIGLEKSKPKLLLDELENNLSVCGFKRRGEILTFECSDIEISMGKVKRNLTKYRNNTENTEHTFLKQVDRAMERAQVTHELISESSPVKKRTKKSLKVAFHTYPFVGDGSKKNASTKN